MRETVADGLDIRLLAQAGVDSLTTTHSADLLKAKARADELRQGLRLADQQLLHPALTGDEP